MKDIEKIDCLVKEVKAGAKVIVNFCEIKVRIKDFDNQHISTDFIDFLRANEIEFYMIYGLFIIKRDSK